MNRLARRFGYAPLKKRALDAGSITRITNSWSGATGSIDRDIYGKLDRARYRSRDLSYNNDYMRKFIGLVRTNIVGPSGFSLQVRAAFPDKRPDVAGNDAVEQSFWRWSKRGVTEVTRKFSFTQFCHLMVQSVARDGETLVRKVFSGNDYGFSLQLLDIDRLETRRNEILGGGRVIKMGVELSSLGEPLAYHLRTQHPNDIHAFSTALSDLERVPASDIYHVGVFERPEQTRALPWAVSAIIRLENIGAYEEAAVIAARYGAAKMGYWVPGDGDAGTFADDTDATGQFFTDFEPGELRVAPAGAELKSIDWKYPHEQYEPFVKACVRGIASGIGVSYASLSNDLSQVNFSSIRSGVVDERDNWMALQGWFIESFLEPLYADWLRMALLKGQVKTANGGVITTDKFDKFNVPEWRGRRWQWVDPRADIDAAVTAIGNGLKSRREIAAEQGRDLEEIWRDLKAEKELAAELGLNIGEQKATDNGKDKESQDAA